MDSLIDKAFMVAVSMAIAGIILRWIGYDNILQGLASLISISAFAVFVVCWLWAGIVDVVKWIRS